MRKTLIILWVVILAGSIFIAINLTKPHSQTDKEIAKLTDQNPNQQTGSGQVSQGYEEYISLGDQYSNDKNYPLAVRNYTFAVESEPKEVEALTKLGEAYLKNNEPLKAFDAFTKAQTLDPESTDIKLDIVQSYFNSRNFEKARDILETLDNQNEKVRYYNAITLILFKQFDEAKAIFNDILKNKSADKTIAESSKKFIEKYNTFETFKEGSPLFLQTLLAKALTENDQYEAAIPLLYDVINQKGNYRDAWIVLGYAYLNTNKPTDAIDALSQAETLSPEKPETLFFLGLSYFANNNIDKAIYYIDQADQKGFQPKELVEVKLGDLYLLQQQYKKSAEKYDKILSVNTSNLDIFSKDIWLYIEKLNNPQRALELAQKALTVHPDSAMSANLVGWSYIALQDYDNAKEFLKKSLEIDPEFATAYLNIGLLYEKQKSDDLAKKYYKKAYNLAKGNPVGNIAKLKLDNLFGLATENINQNQYFQANITSP